MLAAQQRRQRQGNGRAKAGQAAGGKGARQSARPQRGALLPCRPAALLPCRPAWAWPGPARWPAISPRRARPSHAAVCIAHANLDSRDFFRASPSTREMLPARCALRHGATSQPMNDSRGRGHRGSAPKWCCCCAPCSGVPASRVRTCNRARAKALVKKWSRVLVWEELDGAPGPPGRGDE